ncbi:MAG: FAD-dependent oxidoreductase, partial [Planctomycetales bacterium]|nr:FAD-dependent oxidoreductase [Planctomycetales bacterium]
MMRCIQVYHAQTAAGQRRRIHAQFDSPQVVMKHLPLVLLLVVALPLQAQANPSSIDVDVCVYAATPSGILAAVAVRREGRSVVIVEPSRWVGGMLGAGLKPMQDCPNFAATGGMTRELLPTLGRRAETAKHGAAHVFGPDSIRDDFQRLLDKHGVRVVFDHRI